MPAFGAAIAMGAQEIEFDLWYTKDGQIVSIHDATLDRVSDGSGKVYDHTYEELCRLDFGIKFGEKFRGLRILKFEDILEKFAGQVVLNIHIKTLDDECIYDEEIFRKIVALIDQYDCRDSVYFMTGNDRLLEMAGRLAPDIPRCCGEREQVFYRKEGTRIVDRAIALGCQKVQLYKRFFSREMIDKAHAHGIICNMFWSDDEEETDRFLEMGIDTILTNEYNLIAQRVRK